MNQCWITVDEGNDTSLLSSREAPTYEAVYVPIENGEPSRIVFCVFSPTNGANRGKMLRVPFHRIISVASNLHDEEPFVRGEDRGPISGGP